MLHRDFQLKLKGLSDEGSFTGMAAVYGETDLTGDIIEPGSFRQAIVHQGKGFPLLWSHRQDEPIGIARIEDSREGQAVDGKLLMDDPAAQRAHLHMKSGAIRGLSIGFTIPRGDGKVQYRDDGIRVLKEIRLHEISVVAVPAQPRAQISGVKALGDVRLLLKGLRDGDVTEETLGELLEIHSELKRLLIGNDPEEQRSETLSYLRAFASDLGRSAA